MIRFLLTMIPILVVAPNLVGLLFVDVKDKKIHAEVFSLESMIDNYLRGFFTMLAIFEFLCVPLSYFQCNLSTLSILFTICVLVIGAYNVLRLKKEIDGSRILSEFKKTFSAMIEYAKRFFNIKEKSVSIFMRFLVFSIFVLILLQLYHSLFYDVHFWSSDDVVYVTRSMTSVYTDKIVMGGDTNAELAFNARRGLNSWEIFIAYLCQLSGKNAAVMCHSVLNTFFIVLVYSVFYIISLRLFKRAEDRCLFIFIISIVNLYGYHSIYSFAFRMLMTPWQAKAVLMALLIPYTFYKLSCMFEESHIINDVAILSVLSTAACALTMTGAGMESVIICGSSLISAIALKKSEYLLYMIGVWPSVMIVILYMILRTGFLY